MKLIFPSLDIDECATDAHNCSAEQICRNIVGSHMCEYRLCQDGYKRNTETELCEGKI